jgi:hypothetical protein
MTAIALLQAYARRIRELRRANAAVPETALAPAFQQLLEGLIPLCPVAPQLVVVPEYRNPGVGRPDIALVRQGAPARAFVELKAADKPADPTRWRAQDKSQFERFKELRCWATCNFAEIRLFHREEERGTALVVPSATLRPDQNDARADRAVAEHDATPLLRLVEQLALGAGQEPVARDAEHLASLLAHSARLVRGIVRDRLAELHRAGNTAHALLQVRQDLRDQVEPSLGGGQTYNVDDETFFSYRPLDQRWFYNDLRLLNRPGPTMQQVWGGRNVGLYALPSGTGSGPGVWCHGCLPDYHAFRGSYGGYAFPLHDRRPDHGPINLRPELIEGLSAAYGEPVAAEDAFDAILCLLSANSYTLRFAEDLEDVFPHVPFPFAHGTFQDAVRIGREIRAVETFAREPSANYRPPTFVQLATSPRGALASVDYGDGGIVLCADGSGRIIGLPVSVWEFAISGYRVLPRWLEARVGLPADLALIRELRDICGRIAELIALFSEADIVLEATLRESLTREALGLTAGKQEADDGPD